MQPDFGVFISGFRTLKIAAKCLGIHSVVKIKIPGQSKAFLPIIGNNNSKGNNSSNNKGKEGSKKKKKQPNEESYKQCALTYFGAFPFYQTVFTKTKSASSETNMIILS